MSQLMFRFLLSISILFVCVGNVTAQTSSRWLYVSLSADEWKFYRQDKIDKLENGNPATWLKLLDVTGFYRTMYYEWDCKGKRYRLLQSHFFSPDAKMQPKKQPDNTNWEFLPPDSVAGIVFNIACNPPVAPKIIEITAIRANLRNSPHPKASIGRTAEKGTRFQVAPGEKVGDWFNIVEEETQQDYWVYRNAIKFVEQKK